MGKSVSACAFALALAVASCGGPPAPQAPDLGSLSIAPPAPTAKASAPVALARPENVLAWIRLDDLDGILDLVGVNAQSLATNPMLSEILPYYETIEPHRPIDVIVLATGKRAKDVQVAARFGLRDAKGFFRAVSKHYDLSEQGDRVIVRKQRAAPNAGEEDEEPDGEVVMVCDLAGTSAERATCGSQAAMDSVAEWLRGGPEPRPEDSVRTGKGGSMGRAVLYGSALRKVLAANVPRRDDSTEKTLFDLLDDVDVVSMDLAREDKELSFVFGARLRSATSTIAKQMLSTPNDEKPGDPFFRIWQNGSAVLFVPGGGALPTWASWFTDSVSTPHGDEAHAGDASSAAKAISKVLEKPVTIGYGVRLDQAKIALAAVRAAKDPEKATNALERALDPYLVYAVSVDVTAAERALKDVATSWTASNEDVAKRYGASYPSTRHAVRPAPAKLGLPRGSFFFDTTSADWKHSTGNPSGMKTKTEHIVHVPIGSATWGLTCADERTCAEGAKKLLANTATNAPKRSLDPLFERKGIAFAGYLSSLVGAFTMHRVSLGTPSGGVSNDVLTEIEHDLASPRLELPFVVTAEKHGDGGTVALEMRGERDAVRMLGEHAGLGGGSGLGILVYVAMMLRH